MRRCIPSRPTPASQTPVVDKSLGITNATHAARSSLKWGAINGLLFLIVSYDILYCCPWYTSTIYYCEWILAVFLFLNTLFHLLRYLKNTFFIEPLFLTPKQKKLLGIKDSNAFIKDFSVPQKGDESSPCLTPNALSTPMNLSALSWRSASLLSSRNDSSLSPNYTMSSPSWVYYQGSPDASLSSNVKGARQQTTVSSPNTSMISNTSSNGLIEDEQSLSQYLKDFEAHEKTAAVSMSVEQPSNLLSSFWSHPASRTSNETSPLLRRCTYQMAPPTPSQVSSGPGIGSAEDGGLSSSLYQSQEVWRRVRVNPSILTQWTSNLRMWISQTVLERLSKEIANVDESLLRQGLADVRIGAVGLERLKKTAQIAQVAHNIPTLACVIPFLDFTPHQEYLVARIKDLAKGGCMSEFRWNSGGCYQGKDWEENLPTDSAVVLHLLATYLDSQLPPLSQNPEGRPFSSQHLVKTPDKPTKTPNTLVIYQTQINPPHFVLVVGEDTLEVAKGRSNLFQTVLLFLHQVKTRESGMLGRVNLGPSGINMLWIIDE